MQNPRLILPFRNFFLLKFIIAKDPQVKRNIKIAETSCLQFWSKEKLIVIIIILNPNGTASKIHGMV